MESGKVRGWLEVVADLLDLFSPVVTNPKLLELVDEVFQLLDLPDPLPNIDGLQADDNGTPVSVLEFLRGTPGVTLAQEGVQGSVGGAGDVGQEQPLTQAQIKAIRAAKKAAQSQ